MLFQIIIILALVLSTGGLVYWFLNKKRIMDLLHSENISVLERAMTLHRSQIDFRKYNLNNYDFLKYNLQDTLVVQPKILL